MARCVRTWMSVVDGFMMWICSDGTDRQMDRYTNELSSRRLCA
jgi:hypothetical protein